MILMTPITLIIGGQNRMMRMKFRGSEIVLDPPLGPRRQSFASWRVTMRRAPPVVAVLAIPASQLMPATHRSFLLLALGRPPCRCVSVRSPASLQTRARCLASPSCRPCRLGLGLLLVLRGALTCPHLTRNRRYGLTLLSAHMVELVHGSRASLCQPLTPWSVRSRCWVVLRHRGSSTTITTGHLFSPGGRFAADPGSCRSHANGRRPHALGS